MITDREIEEKVKGILKEVLMELKNKEVNLEKKHDEYESWDSFAHLSIITSIEEKFKITIDAMDAAEINSGKEIVGIVKEKILEGNKHGRRINV